MTDDFQLFDQSSDDPVDADIALISAYLARELSPVQIVAVEDRLASDIAFRKKVAPILDAWVMPTALSAVHAGQGPLSRDEVEAGWTRYVGEHVELDAHEGPRLVVEGAQRKRRKISMTRIAAGIAAITLPVFALAQVVVYASKHPNVPGHSAAKEFMAPFVVEPPTSDATPTPLPHKPPPAPVDVPIGRQLDTKTADVQRVAEVVLPAAESLKALAPTPVAQTVPWQPSNPDRAKIMELVKQHMPEIVRGDTTADYALVLLDASDNYVWSTHGLGGVTLVIGGDKRTAAERAEFSFRNASQYSGVMVDSIGRLGRVSRGGGGAGFAYDSMVVAGRAGRGSVAAGERDTLRFQRVPDSVIARIRDTVSGVIGRIDTARAGARGGLGGGGGRGGFARGGGGGGGRASGAVAYGGFDVGPLDSGSYVLSIGAPIAVGGVRVPLNTAAGLQEPGRDESGIQGLKASSLTMVENYFFTRGQLAPRPLRVLVGHLAPGTRWTGR
jgi:hypothetical protein